MKRALILLSLLLTLTTATGSPRRHLVVAYLPPVPDAWRDALANESASLLFQAEPGTRITILDAASLTTVADVTVPDAAIRVRQHRLAPEIQRTLRVIRSATNPPAAVHLPPIFDHLALQLRRPLGSPEVLLVAPCLQRNPKESAFDMYDSWPSDGHLTAGSARSIYATSARSHRLRGITVQWLVTDFEALVNDSHREGVTRFWTLFVATQEGRLGGFSPDYRNALQRFKGGDQIPLPTPRLDPNDQEVVMHSRTRRVQTAQNPVSVVPSIPPPPPGKTAIAMLWDRGPDTNHPVDLDLHVQPARGGPELYFGQPASAHGRLLRDIRQALPGSSNTWRTTWEYVELEGEALPPAVWINLYEGRGPIRGIVRTFAQGREEDIPFELPAVLGDRASDQFRRATSPQWIRVELSATANRSLDTGFQDQHPSVPLRGPRDQAAAQAP